MTIGSAVRNGLRPAMFIALGSLTFGATPVHAAAFVTAARNPTTTTTPAHHDRAIGDALSAIASLSGGWFPTGTITFTIYGPNDPNCTGTGTMVGAPVAVHGNGSYRTTDTYDAPAPGVYSWISRYSGDLNNKPAVAACVDQRVVVRDDDHSRTCPTDRDTRNRGVDNLGDGNRGSFNNGDGNRGSFNNGDGNRGSYNNGDCNSGSRVDGDEDGRGFFD